MWCRQRLLSSVDRHSKAAAPLVVLSLRPQSDPHLLPHHPCVSTPRPPPADCHNPTPIAIQSEVDTESVGHVLCKKADELDAVAIVMASHNKGRMAEFFLGSVTNYCTHHSHRPVVIVPSMK